MDYEKKYKNALAHAREIHRNEEGKRKDMEFLFPELKESEDERIRKTLIRFHKSTIDVDGIKGEDIIAWLENLNLIKAKSPQLGRQKSAWSEEDEQITLSIEQVMNCASLLNIVPEKTDKIRTWLKTLKERIGG